MILKLVYKDHIYWYNISAIKAWEAKFLHNGYKLG